MSEASKKAEAGTGSRPPSVDDGAQLARRKLLKSGFIAPAVLASFVLSRDALAKTSFCDKNPDHKKCQPKLGFDDSEQ
ncbi:MAG: hypothetical protein L0Y66_16985 [Myxococcaceae bacterium]|nr:hypothetical protein [Myxococcaceae bacterium]MCI0672304.1 hypothetical protein [Myxococcaceae bacterium]